MHHQANAPCDMSGRKLQYPFSGASLCVHSIKAIICHDKQLLPHKEKLSDDMAFGNGDAFLLVSFPLFLSILSQLLLRRPWVARQTRGSVCQCRETGGGTGLSLLSISSEIFVETMTSTGSARGAKYSCHRLEVSHFVCSNFIDGKECLSLPRAAATSNQDWGI